HSSLLPTLSMLWSLIYSRQNFTTRLNWRSMWNDVRPWVCCRSLSVTYSSIIPGHVTRDPPAELWRVGDGRPGVLFFSCFRCDHPPPTTGHKRQRFCGLV